MTRFARMPDAGLFHRAARTLYRKGSRFLVRVKLEVARLSRDARWVRSDSGSR